METEVKKEEKIQEVVEKIKEKPQLGNEDKTDKGLKEVSVPVSVVDKNVTQQLPGLEMEKAKEEVKKIPKLVVQMIVRNEADRYLKQILGPVCNSEAVSRVIIIDDGSTDKTSELCRSFPKTKVITQKTSLFDVNESALREKLWNLVKSENPDWVLSLDADELFESKFWSELPAMLETNYEWFAFRLLDMWDAEHYRIDGHWSPMFTRLFRFRSEPFGRQGTIHSGCVPTYINDMRYGQARADIRCKHLGWSTPEEKERKYDFYMGKCAFGVNRIHALSIKKPATLKKYEDVIEIPNIIITSLVRNREWCLDQFLTGIKLLDYPKNKLSFYFLINDSKDKSKEMLEKFKKENKEYRHIEIEEINFEDTPSEEHKWTVQRLRNMGEMRNRCLSKIGDNDYLFSIDTDIVIQHKELLKHLVSLEREVVSEVFWAYWGRRDVDALPNVWIRGGYETSFEFLNLLRNKGTFEVGGLGAITLIRKDVIERGVNYNWLVSLPQNMEGEDRHFCVRCATMGVILWADTWYAPKHLEQDEKSFLTNIKEAREARKKDNTLALCTIMRNESQFLQTFLEQVSPLCDQIVIVDTGSTDNSIEIAKKFGAEVYSYDWKKGYFCGARNFAKSKCKTKWLLHMDPDEFLRMDQAHELFDLMEDETCVGYLFEVANYHLNFKMTMSESCRLFKNIPEVYYTNRCHETTEDSVKKMRGTLLMAPMMLHHRGYLRGNQYVEQKLQMYENLNTMDMKANPDDARPVFNLALHWLNNGDTEKGMQYLKKACKLNPNFFQPRKELAMEYIRRGDQLLRESFGLIPDTHPLKRFTHEQIRLLTQVCQDRVVVGKAGVQLAEKGK